jgi:hypothetical protein
VVDTNNNVHVIWYEDIEYIGATSEVRHRFYDGAWGPVETIATGNNIWTPSMAAGAHGSIHVAWHDERYTDTGEHEIFYKAFDGLVWGPRQQISDAPGESSNSSVVVKGDSTVYVFWADERQGGTEIYHRMFDGAVWHAEARLSFASGESRYPSAAIDRDGLVHVVWQDMRDGDREVYHKVRDPGALAGATTPGGAVSLLDPIRVLPNPVRGPVRILLTVPQSSKTDVAVYDVTGRLVRTWDLGTSATGRYDLAWDVTDSHGQAVAPGIYFIKVGTAEQAASAKVIVLK